MEGKGERKEWSKKKKKGKKREGGTAMGPLTVSWIISVYQS